MMEKKLFIHIPKNGGMTIRNSPLLKKRIQIVKKNCVPTDYLQKLTKIMRDLGRKRTQQKPTEHARWIDVKTDIVGKLGAFAIVRNPWSRVVSRYTFAKSHGQYEGSFEDFLETRHESLGHDMSWHLAIKGWHNALEYVTDLSGTIKCDILRFENYNEDVVKYFNFSEKTVLDIRNVSNGIKASDRKSINNRKDYKSFYNQKSIQIVADWYKDDIDTWGFDFDTGAKKNYWNNND